MLAWATADLKHPILLLNIRESGTVNPALIRIELNIINIPLGHRVPPRLNRLILFKINRIAVLIDLVFLL